MFANPFLLPLNAFSVNPSSIPLRLMQYTVTMATTMITATTTSIGTITLTRKVEDLVPVSFPCASEGGIERNSKEIKQEVIQ